MRFTSPRTGEGCFLLIDSRGYIDLSKWNMSCEFGEGIDVRDFPEELGADDCPCEREQHYSRQIRPSETRLLIVQMSRRDLLLVKKLEWTMNWIISSTEGGEKPDGTREGKGREEIVISSTEVIHG